MPDRQRLLSAMIALACATAMWRREGWPGALALLVPLAFAPGMIRHAGSLGRIRIPGMAGKRIDHPSPPMAIRFFGWVLLLIPAVIMLAQRLRAI